MSSHPKVSRLAVPDVAGAKPSEDSRSESERGAAEAASGGVGRGAVPDPAVRTRGRRTFSAEYKARVLRELEACTGHGEVGALLRREGLYSSHIVQWKRQRAEAEERGLAPRKRGPRGKSAEVRRAEQLERENAKLQEDLRKANIIISYQKKVHALLGIPLPEVPDVGER
jgi:transposase